MLVHREHFCAVNASKHSRMALERCSVEHRGFLALGNLCLAVAMLIGAEDTSVDWLTQGLSDFELQKRYQFSLAKSILSLLPLLSEQLKIDIKPELVKVIEHSVISPREQAVLLHEIGTFFSSQGNSKEASRYFKKAQRLLNNPYLLSSKHKKHRRVVNLVKWEASKDINQHTYHFSRVKEQQAVARYYVKTAKQIGGWRARGLTKTLNQMCDRLTNRLSEA